MKPSDNSRQQQNGSNWALSSSEVVPFDQDDTLSANFGNDAILDDIFKSKLNNYEEKTIATTRGVPVRSGAEAEADIVCRGALSSISLFVRNSLDKSSGSRMLGLDMCGGEAELLSTLEELRDDPDYVASLDSGAGCAGRSRDNSNRIVNSVEITSNESFVSLASSESAVVAPGGSVDNYMEDLEN